MKKVLFIDRDGTLITEPGDEQVDSIDKLEYYPGVFQAMGRIARELDYELVMVTNQDGLGTDSFPEETFWPAHNRMIHIFENESIIFTQVYIDRSFPEDDLPTRKPGTGMLKDYIDSAEYDLESSFVIGDRITDMELARNLGSRGIFLDNGLNLGSAETNSKEEDLKDVIALKTSQWFDIYSFLRNFDRKATIIRNTSETKISVDLVLDGTGRSEIDTGIGFFDHMLDQLARHGNLDLSIHVDGDLHVDEHHTIEDTAIALGEAFQLALKDKKGLARYGFTVPMDDSLAQVAIDFGGRSWIEWEAVFTREKIGEMPTEMFFHFFKSFSDGARCNLNIKAEGQNEHHKIEAIFKAWARAIKMAIKRDLREETLPTTKGLL